jgi:hypothetical protein
MKNYLLQFFKFDHLPKGPMQETSQRFAELAVTLEEILPTNPETTVAFRKLLEAKDCAVRSLIFQEGER